MGQTGKKWKLSEIYRGFGFQILRTTSILVVVYSFLDYFRRKTKFMDSLKGNFFVTAGASAVAYVSFWPLV